MCIYILLISREPEILHDKRFSYQANPRFDMILKIILYFYIFIVINFLLRTKKAYEEVFWLPSKSETLHGMQYLYQRSNIIFLLFLYFLFREN